MERREIYVKMENAFVALATLEFVFNPVSSKILVPLVQVV
jgi:hypothetical protein